MADLPSTKLRSIDELPGPGPSIPFLGTSWIYLPIVGRYRLESLHEANVDKYRCYGKIFREEFQWGVPFVQVYDPVDIATVLRSQGRFPLRPVNEAAVLFRKSRPDVYGSVGLVNASGEEWHRLRNSLASIIIQPRVVQNYLSSQSQVGNDLVTLLEQLRLGGDDGRISNMMEPLHRHALESAVMFCLDIRLGCLDQQMQSDSDAHRMITCSVELFQAYQDLYYGLPLWRYVSTAPYRQMERAELTMHSIVSKYIEKVKEDAKGQLDDSDVRKEMDTPSVVRALLSASDVNYKDVYTGIVDFIIAGIDSTANSIVFILYNIARHADVQQRLYEEISEVMADDDVVQARHLNSMKYLKACVKETFRLMPTIPNIVRITTEELVLSSYLIPKGTVVCCQTMVSGRLPEYVDRPDEFWPDRWLNGSHPNISCHPFGYGPRMCPGRRFAEQEIYVALIKLLQKFRLESDDPLQLHYWFLVTPKPPVTFRLIHR